MCVWINENVLNKEIAGVGSVTLMTRVTGFEELQSEMPDRDPCSLFVTESAWPTWGVPSLPTYLSVCFPELFDRLLGNPMVSPGGDPVLGFSKSRLGIRRAACTWRRFGFHARRVIVVGHT